MPWQFQQSTGFITEPGGLTRGISYAGRGEGKNNPLLQDVRGGARWDAEKWMWIPVPGLSEEDYGPLPCGFYTMQPPVDTETHGPYVIWLVPDAGNQMFNRSGFGWHGDAIEHPGLASEGCICSPRTLRMLGWNGGDHRMQVVM